MNDQICWWSYDVKSLITMPKFRTSIIKWEFFIYLTNSRDEGDISGSLMDTIDSFLAASKAYIGNRSFNSAGIYNYHPEMRI